MAKVNQGLPSKGEILGLGLLAIGIGNEEDRNPIEVMIDLVDERLHGVVVPKTSDCPVCGSNAYFAEENGVPYCSVCHTPNKEKII